jgi:hypothetical protein
MSKLHGERREGNHTDIHAKVTSGNATSATAEQFILRNISDYSPIPL